MANTREANARELADDEVRHARRGSRIGTFVLTLNGEQDLDEHDNERHAPAGSVGRITHHNHSDGITDAWDVLFPNGCWVVIDDNELRDPKQYRTATVAEVAEWAGLRDGRMFSAQSAAAQTELAERYFDLHEADAGEVIPAVPDPAVIDDDTGQPVMRPAHLIVGGNAYWIEPAVPCTTGPLLMFAPLDVHGRVLWDGGGEVGEPTAEDVTMRQRLIDAQEEAQEDAQEEADARLIEKATEAALDAGCKVIQDALGVTAGDYAGIHFSGSGPFDNAQPVRDVFAGYVRGERADVARDRQYIDRGPAARIGNRATPTAQPATEETTAQLRADIGRLREAGRAMLDAFGNCGSPAQQQAADWMTSLIEQTAYVEGDERDEPVSF